MRWRRLCVDVDDDGTVLGASIEHYEDRGVGPDTVVVLARSFWRGKSPQDVLEDEIEVGWPQGSLPFEMHPKPPSV